MVPTLLLRMATAAVPVTFPVTLTMPPEMFAMAVFTPLVTDDPVTLPVTFTVPLELLAME
jgi:hypothetical protein